MFLDIRRQRHRLVQHFSKYNNLVSWTYQSIRLQMLPFQELSSFVHFSEQGFQICVGQKIM